MTTALWTIDAMRVAILRLSLSDHDGVLRRGHHPVEEAGVLPAVNDLRGGVTLLDRLATHAEVLANLGPRGAGTARFIDEMANQVLGESAHGRRSFERIIEALQRVPVRMQLLDVENQCVKRR